ncbi:Glycosyltransferase involved in cell wall bisynthesis [Desulfonatronum thiosulfatophilum]|uniref:Glycosyltransferase involved in cell wall bisynthesis n=1 Tax=Desulfonatronum thiosulfatophilum TaxID=617002 RepID=A0A1G6ELD5_9BACT|nr:glycosyltransferase family 2 protein [Desulfonatronum thiosulfatophilum]SDB58208.1 Glycosyltransferase involved in cell wall bisynthesis [Desulfonatronum thiosulfatophilum]
MPISKNQKISIIIPCHNAERYLSQTLGSVLDQSLAPHEVIVVDDGSTDSSLDIARRFETAFAGLIHVHSQRSGCASRTRNLGASFASGDALMFLDADDVLAPDALEALAEALFACPGGVAACSWQRLELVDGTWRSGPASCAPRRQDQDVLAAWLIGWYHPPCSILWSREAFQEAGCWDEAATLNDDGDLMMRAFIGGIQMVEAVSGTAYYRRLPKGQISLSGHRYTYSGLAGRLAIIEKVVRLLEEQRRVDNYRPEISRAFGLIAADAAWRFGALCEQARRRSREYAPSLSIRAKGLLNRLRREPAAARQIPVAAQGLGEEIRFGLDRAREVLDSSFSATTITDAKPSKQVDRPEVSVIIPVYNRAHLLQRTIESVLGQTFPHFEVIVVDDCSGDDPASVLAKQGDRRVRYFRQPRNCGVAAARNRGLREARADLVAFLDDDDEWFPEKLALQVELMNRSPENVGLIYTGVESVFSDGSRSVQIPSARGDLYRELLVRNLLHGGGTNIMMRRNVVTTIGFFDETFPAIEDYDYWLRVSRLYKVDYVDMPLVRYNDHDPSRGNGKETRRSTKIKANLEARKQFYRKHGAQMREHGLAHLFLVDSAHRHLTPGWDDVNGARRLALQACLLAPASREVRDVLKKLFVPETLRGFVRKRRNWLNNRCNRSGLRKFIS